MFINKLILRGNVRLLCKNIQEIELSFTEIYQLIIGTNGTGKTTILRELTPLPGSNSDYVKGTGYKAIYITHKKHTYILESDFTQGNKHSFYYDGENLNTGRTAAVQKDLVSEHFGLDTTILAVLLDDDLFTYMAPNERREWVMRLSGNDLGYAMSVFNKLRSRFRDMQGVVRHLGQRISEEVDKLPSDTALAKLQAECLECQEELMVLMENRDPTVTEAHVVEQRIEKTLSQLQTLALQILRHPVQKPKWPVLTDEASLTDAVGATSNHLAAARMRLDKCHDDAMRLQNLQRSMTESNASGVDELHSNRDQLLAEQQTLIGRMFAPIELKGSANDALVVTETIFADLMEIFTQMPDNNEGKHNEDFYNSMVQQRDTLQTELNDLSQRLGKTVHRIEHIGSIEQHNCPKCGYMWKPGISDDAATKLNDSRAQPESRIAVLESRISDMSAYFEEHHLFKTYIRRLNQFVKNQTMLTPLWGRVAEAWRKGAAPRAAMPVLIQWRQDLGCLADAENITTRIAEIDRTLHELSLIGESTGDQLAAHIDDISQQIESAIMEVQGDTGELRALTRFQEQIKFMAGRHSELIAVAHTLEQQSDLLIRAIRNDSITDLIRQRQSTLAHAETALRIATGAIALIDDLRVSRDKALQDAEILDVLIQELSPVDGLIADQVKGFIACFVEQMNAVIAQVWTSELEILPCESENEELTYKFPLAVNGGGPVVPDVRKGSASQRDVVNFAFKLVVCLYLGLDDYPIYLDELAITLDEQHRFNMIDFVKQYVETRRCSQCFLISHYAQQHGAFHGAEVCVTDSTNIVNMPGVYNQHVRIR